MNGYEDRHFSFGSIAVRANTPTQIQLNGHRGNGCKIASTSTSSTSIHVMPENGLSQQSTCAVQSTLQRDSPLSNGNINSANRSSNATNAVDSKKVCIICHSTNTGNFGKNYSTKRSVEDYMKCFPNYDGTPGRVCQHCYNQMYTMRRKEQESKGPKKISARASSKRGKKKQTIDISNTNDQNNKNQSKDEIELDNMEDQLELCACCNEVLVDELRAYKYFELANEYSTLFPNSIKNMNGNVCYKCYRKCDKYRLEKEGSPKKRQRATISAEENNEPKKLKLSISTNGTSLESSHSSQEELLSPEVDIFVEYRFPKEFKIPRPERLSSDNIIIRITTSHTISISALQDVLQHNVEQIAGHCNYRLSAPRRIVKDHTGTIIEESLLQEIILQRYPLIPKERLTVDVIEKIE
jgi:hypothetical protein